MKAILPFIFILVCSISVFAQPCDCTLTQGNFSSPLPFMSSNSSAVNFYSYGNPVGASANTGLEMSETLLVMLTRTSRKNWHRWKKKSRKKEKSARSHWEVEKKNLLPQLLQISLKSRTTILFRGGLRLFCLTRFFAGQKCGIFFQIIKDFYETHSN